MNFLDIILIVVNILIILFGIISVPLAIKDEYYEFWRPACITVWGFCIFFGWLLIIPFVVIDKNSGFTIGTITSVEKNFFGTTALYIKTTETIEEKYCIEFNEELENQAKELIGQKVKIGYGKRVGFYSTGKCSQAPVETIELLD